MELTSKWLLALLAALTLALAASCSCGNDDDDDDAICEIDQCPVGETLQNPGSADCECVGDDPDPTCDVASCPEGQSLKNPGSPDCECVDDPRCEIDSCGFGEELTNADSPDCECVLVSCPIPSCNEGETLERPNSVDCFCTALPELRYKAVISESELKLDQWRNATLRDAKAALDFNGDGWVGRPDRAQQVACGEGVQPTNDIDCDLTADGKLDDRDTLLFDLLVGRTQARSEQYRQDAKTNMQEMMNGTDPFSEDVDLLDYWADYDGDGDVTSADVDLFGDLLGGDPVAALDQNGDGFLDFADALALARGLAREEFGGPAAGPDLNGDGETDEDDVLLLTGLAAAANSVFPGFLDHNLDGRVDEGDYCLTSDNPLQPNFYAQVTDEATADAAFDAETPNLLICRKDGKSLQRFPERQNSGYRLHVQVPNLYLEEVGSVPVDYEIANAGDLVGAAKMFVISDAPSDQTLELITLPWDLDNDDPGDIVLEFGGVALDEGSAILLPYRAIFSGTLAVAKKGKSGRVSQATTIAAAPPIFRPLLNGSQGASRDSFFNELEATKQMVDAILNSGCPCALSEADRKAVARYLYRAQRCMEATLAGLNSLRRAVQNEHDTITAAHVAAGQAAASSWHTLSDVIWEVAVSDVLLLILDIAKEGNLPGALKAALENLITEVISDLDSSGDLPDYLTGEGTYLDDASSGLASNGITAGVSETLISGGDVGQLNDWLRGRTPEKALEDTFKGLLRQSGGASSRDALKNILNSMKSRLGQIAGSGGKAILVAFIKNIPKMVRRYYVRNTLQAEATAVAAAGAYNGSVLKLGGLDAAIAEIGQGKTDIEGKREALLDAFEDGDCYLSVNDGLPCLEAFQNKLANENDTHREQVDGINGDIAELENDPAFNDSAFNDSCHSGAYDNRLDLTGLHGCESALVDGPSLTPGGPNAESAAANAADAAADSAQANEDFWDDCDDSFDAPKTPEEARAKIEKLKEDLETENANHAQNVRDLYEEYRACAGSEDSCPAPDFSTLATDPWAIALGCVGCRPSPIPECCGDGAVEDALGEDCDPNTTDPSCEAGWECNSSCECEETSTSVCPPPTGSILLGGQFSIYSDPWNHQCCGNVPLGMSLNIQIDGTGPGTISVVGQPGYDILGMTGTSTELLGDCLIGASGIGSYAGIPGTPCWFDSLLIRDDGSFSGHYWCEPFSGQPIDYEFIGNLIP